MVKRIFDLFFVIPGILILLPLFLLLAVWIKIDSKGPILFKQKRVGRYEKIFNVYKFRSMVTDAEKMGLKITVGHDPRITQSGYYLRKYKLDEFPQLFNVLFGHMSLVGPRPEVPEYVSLYPEVTRKKVLSVRPGITDPASLKYKDENALLENAKDPNYTYIHEIMPKKLKYYSEYVENQHLWLDFKLILTTLFQVFC